MARNAASFIHVTKATAKEDDVKLVSAVFDFLVTKRAVVFDNATSTSVRGERFYLQMMMMLCVQSLRAICTANN
jgi:hypothetical protein